MSSKDMVIQGFNIFSPQIIEHIKTRYANGNSRPDLRQAQKRGDV